MPRCDWLQTTRNNKITCRFFVAAPLVKNQKRALIIAWLYLRPQLKQKCSDPRRRNTSGSLSHRTQMQIHAGKQSRECPHKNWSWLLQYFLTYRVNNKVVTHIRTSDIRIDVYLYCTRDRSGSRSRVTGSKCITVCILFIIWQIFWRQIFLSQISIQCITDFTVYKLFTTKRIFLQPD